MGFSVGGAISGGLSGGLGGAIAGGISGDKMDKANKAAQQGIQNEIDFQRESRDMSLARNLPYVESGYSALNAMNTMLNLDPVNTPRYGENGLQIPDYDSISSEADANQYARSLGYEGADVGKEIWSQVQGKGSTSRGAANYQDQRVPGRGGALSTFRDRVFNRGKDNYELTHYLKNQDRYAEEAKGGSEYQWQTDPGYQFRLDEGNKAISRRQSAGGSYLSGAGQKGVAEYSQNYAAAEFGDIFNRLGTIAGYATSATRDSNQITQHAGNMIGQGMNNMGQQRASGYADESKTWGDIVGASGGSMFGSGFVGSVIGGMMG